MEVMEVDSVAKKKKKKKKTDQLKSISLVLLL